MENVLLLEIKQLYDSLVAAPYGEYVHGYGTQKPNGFKYKSNAQTLFRNSAKRIYLSEIKRVRRITPFSGNELATVLIAVVCIALLV